MFLYQVNLDDAKFIVIIFFLIFPQMSVTWTSGYNINEAVPFVEWGLQGESQIRSPAVTLTFDQKSMCGKINVL